ncbi:MAG: hypothetical protein ACO25B_13620, partial [Chitinophagaceae bacterium]
TKIFLFPIAGFLFLIAGAPVPAAIAWAWLIVTLLQSQETRVMKITRWAKAHPHKAQVLITLLQLLILILGLWVGYNLNQAGYSMPTYMVFIFGTVLFISLLSVPFIPRKTRLILPAVLQKHRRAYIGICLSSFLLMIYTGNYITNRFPGSGIVTVLQASDQIIFPETNRAENLSIPVSSTPAGHATFPFLAASAMNVSPDASIVPSASSKAEAKAAKKAHRIEKRKSRAMKWLAKKRLWMSGGASSGTILLIVLLVATTCGGVCLMIAGIGDGAVGWAILGALAATGSVWGIVALLRGSKKQARQ